MSRLDDPAYTNALVQARVRQESLARRVGMLEANRARMLERARKALGGETDEAKLVAELDAHPSKYPGWKELKVQLGGAQKMLGSECRQGRDMVRNRILKELADKKSAQGGK